MLVQVQVPSGTPLASVRMKAGGRDVTSVLQSTALNTLTGLVTGLALGKNVLTVRNGRALNSRGDAGDHELSDHRPT